MRTKVNVLFLLFIGLTHVTSAQYKGTAAVSKGPATSISDNLYACSGGRIAKTGKSVALDNSSWIVPAETNYKNDSFPFASDLNNICEGHDYNSTSQALAALSGKDIVEIDKDGELITGFIFADNYFELYVNGKAVGKDKVPYTQFNSSVVRFRVKRPFVISMLLVDWEENLGLGSEVNGGFAYHPGDGGMVALFRNQSGEVVAKTDSNWKAQTFYTSPIMDLTCPKEIGNQRLSDQCSTQDVNDGRNFYALHWSLPIGWMNSGFDDSMWPAAHVFGNTTVGVNNKKAYTNFTDVFDDPKNDAVFIWSSNLILDNEVAVRYKVSIPTSNSDILNTSKPVVFPNPSTGIFKIASNTASGEVHFNYGRLYNQFGVLIQEIDERAEELDITAFPDGFYILKINKEQKDYYYKLMKSE